MQPTPRKATLREPVTTGGASGLARRDAAADRPLAEQPALARAARDSGRYDQAGFAIVSLAQPVPIAKGVDAVPASALYTTVYLELPDGRPLAYTSKASPAAIRGQLTARLRATPASPESEWSILDLDPTMLDRAVVVGYAMPAVEAVAKEPQLRRVARGIELSASPAAPAMFGAAEGAR